MRNLFRILAFSLICSGCKDEIHIRGFDSIEWKKDSLACETYRSDKVRLLQDAKESILHKKKDVIVDFLGSPNATNAIVDKITFIYYVEKGPQCSSKLHQNLIEIEEFYIVFKGDLSISAGVTVP